MKKYLPILALICAVGGYLPASRAEQSKEAKESKENKESTDGIDAPPANPTSPGKARRNKAGVQITPAQRRPVGELKAYSFNRTFGGPERLTRSVIVRTGKAD